MDWFGLEASLKVIELFGLSGRILEGHRMGCVGFKGP